MALKPPPLPLLNKGGELIPKAPLCLRHLLLAILGPKVGALGRGLRGGKVSA